MKLFPNFKKASQFFADQDKRLSRLIEIVGPMKMDLDPDESVFQSLSRSIIYQQLHGKAAATIHARFIALFPKHEHPLPKEVKAASVELLRTAGLSNAKSLALIDLADKTEKKLIPDRAATHSMTDLEIVEALTSVRGIGPWTAEMFLIFTLGRPDVLPIGDFAVRKAFGAVYKKGVAPTPEQLLKFGEKWRPYRSIASWYMWRALELAEFNPPKPQKPMKKRS